MCSISSIMIRRTNRRTCQLPKSAKNNFDVYQELPLAIPETARGQLASSKGICCRSQHIERLNLELNIEMQAAVGGSQIKVHGHIERLLRFLD